MSLNSDSLDPYRPPEFSAPPRQERAASGRPTALKAISIIAIVLGAAGLLSVISGCAGLVVTSQLQPPGPRAGEESQQDFMRMQREMQAIHADHLGINITAFLAHLIAASLLIWGGIQVLRLHPTGRPLLTFAFVVTIVFEIARQVMMITLQVQMIDVMQEQMAEMPTAGPAGEWMADLVPIFIVVGIIISLAWTAGKCIFYGFGVAYLRKPHVRALFASSS